MTNPLRTEQAKQGTLDTLPSLLAELALMQERPGGCLVCFLLKSFALYSEREAIEEDGQVHQGHCHYIETRTIKPLWQIHYHFCGLIKHGGDVNIPIAIRLTHYGGASEMCNFDIYRSELLDLLGPDVLRVFATGNLHDWGRTS